ncbi:fimbrial protein [Pseudomonas sp. NPDC089530]|uniref:fimbrial protein n=1 Tax=Pseudomonas sp. NPDC089530 TaxID=3390651 RepID=UPI003D081515
MSLWKMIKPILMVFLALFAIESYAACTFSIPIPHSQNLGATPKPVSFSPSVPNGTILHTIRGGLGSPGDFNCESNTGAVSVRYEGMNLYLGNYIYSTAVSGIGMMFNESGTLLPRKYSTSRGGKIPSFTSYTVSIVKTGKVTAGGTLDGHVASVFLDGQEVIKYMLPPIILKPNVPTCTLLTPNTTVDLGKPTIQNIDNEGGQMRALNLKLQCEGGEQQSSTRMFITFTDAQNPANTSDTLSLSAGSSAEGIGVQIRHGDTGKAIMYGPDSSAPNTLNQWQVGEFGNISVTIPLKANYIKTGPKIIPGKANASATFTLSYQ